MAREGCFFFGLVWKNSGKQNHYYNIIIGRIFALHLNHVQLLHDRGLGHVSLRRSNPLQDQVDRILFDDKNLSLKKNISVRCIKTYERCKTNEPRKVDRNRGPKIGIWAPGQRISAGSARDFWSTNCGRKRDRDRNRIRDSFRAGAPYHSLSLLRDNRPDRST